MTESDGTALDFPNLRGSVGDIPIVTTLLAAISTAVFLAPITSDAFKSSDVVPGGIEWQSADAVLAFGSVSTFFFIGATLAMINTKAKDFGALSDEEQAAALAAVTKTATDAVAALPEAKQKAAREKIETQKAALVRGYKDGMDRWYGYGQACWLTGLAILALATSALVWGYLVELSAALALVAVAPSLGLWVFGRTALARLISVGLTVLAAGACASAGHTFLF